MFELFQKGGPFMFALSGAGLVWSVSLVIQLARRVRAKGLNRGVAAFLATSGLLGTFQGSVMIMDALQHISPEAADTAAAMWFAGWSVALITTVIGLCSAAFVLVVDLALAAFARETDRAAGRTSRAAITAATLATLGGASVGIHTFMEICQAAMRTTMGAVVLSPGAADLAAGFTWATGLCTIAALAALIAAGSGVGGLVRILRPV